MTTQGDKKVAVLVPCYNEAATIEAVVKDFKSVLPKANIYVCDNNSTDETAKIAKSAGAIVSHEPMQGKGNVMRRMFREIEADYYILVDGDSTYFAKDAPKLLKELDKGYDMAIGDRLSSSYFKENKRAFHDFGNVLVRRLVNGLYHGKITDIMTGYRAFSRDFVKTFPVLSKGFEIETEMTIHALDKNMACSNVVVDYRDRPKGSSSKLKTIPDGMRVLKTVAMLFKYYKPLAFFGIVSLLLTLLSLVFIVPVLIEYFQTGLVPKMPSFVTGLILIILGFLSSVCGLILDNVARSNRQSFEQMRINIHRG
jgi:glycosyltransferase involved in cell wall biosynthesis